MIIRSMIAALFVVIVSTTNPQRLICADASHDEVVQITAKISVNSLIEAIALVRTVDQSPLLQVLQDKRESKTITITHPDGHESHPDEDDPDTLIIWTGVVRGPLDGGGQTHHLKKIQGKWQIMSSSRWVS